MRYHLMPFALSLLLVPALSFADEAPKPRQPSPEDMQKIMEATFGAMVPMMAKMTEVVVDAQLRIGAQPETADRLAAFKKNLYDSLVKKGFSANQAMQIVVATNLPAATPSMK